MHRRLRSLALAAAPALALVGPLLLPAAHAAVAPLLANPVGHALPAIDGVLAALVLKTVAKFARRALSSQNALPG